MRKNSGFTLVEVLVAVALTGMILLTGYSAFQKIMEAQARLGATIDVQKNLFYVNEKMAALIREGGSIDYEEYFNRRMLGYGRDMVDTSIDGDLDADTYTFNNFSHFGNGKKETALSQTPIYYCGHIVPASITEETCIDPREAPDTDKGYVNTNKDALLFDALFPTGEQQPYGQYAALAYNYLDPVGYPMPIRLPPIFEAGETIKIVSRDGAGAATLVDKDITNVGLPELYLIKKNLDGSYTRTYFRHVYVQDTFVSTLCNPTSSLEGCIGKIQMLKLKSCDEIDSNGVIDAWIPTSEFQIGTVSCPNNAATIYKSAHEDTILEAPANIPPNLVWVDVTSPDMNIVRATFLPSPLKIPALMSGAGDTGIESPKVSVYLESVLSARLKAKSFVLDNKNYPRTLITTYDLSE